MSANYWASTQCNNWLLDRPQLELAREEDWRYASRVECAALGVFFANLISTITKRLNLRQRVSASACLFFRRFFSKNSYSALCPFLVSATCVYVAAKTEESPIHIKSAVAEAARTFTEVGFRGMPTDNSSLAEMEFYLLEEMEFDLILFHPYRSLVALYEEYGAKPKAKEGGGLGISGEGEWGLSTLKSVEEQVAQPEKGARLGEFDEQVLQMSWFVLNDTYRTDIPLQFPPYMVALGALWLALTLHTPAFDRINDTIASYRELHYLPDSDKRKKERDPSEEALTWFASLNVSLPVLGEVVQELVGMYAMLNEVRELVADGGGMVKLLERMREGRRQDLLRKQREGGVHR